MSTRDCADGDGQSERIDTPREEVPELLADSADEEEAPPKQRVRPPSLPRRRPTGSRGSWNAEGTVGTPKQCVGEGVPLVASTAKPPPARARGPAEAGRVDLGQTSPTGIRADNVPSELSLDDLWDAFGDVGSVKHLGRRGKSAKVWFASEAEAARATSTFHGGSSTERRSR